MSTALSRNHGLAPAEAHGLVISYLRDVFKYPDKQVVQFADLLIRTVQEPDFQPTLKAICHRGVNGYAFLKQGQIDRLRQDLEDLLGILTLELAEPVFVPRSLTSLTMPISN